MIFFRKIQYQKLSDVELVTYYSKYGKPEYVGELFSRYSHLVYGVCLYYLNNRSDAKDAVLSIFERLLSDLKTNEISNFKAWIHTVSRNFCLVQIRGKNRSTLRNHIFSNEFENELTHQPDFEFKQDDKTYKEVYTAINELNKEQKLCIELFYLQNKSYNEIVIITGFTPDQVKSYIQNGKRNLKNILITKR
jgi:RNA polymerase sigma factor (sigma-70 family)